jgi:hypothetical protein
MIAYLSRIAAWLSQGINCIVFLGHHDQTISARVYVNRARWPRLYRALNAIFFWQDDHCYESHIADVLFAMDLVLAGKPGPARPTSPHLTPLITEGAIVKKPNLNAQYARAESITDRVLLWLAARSWTAAIVAVALLAVAVAMYAW